MVAWDLQGAWRWARDWLFEDALPLWSAAGVDPDGGFRDQLDDAGRPVDAPKRLRVQGRQTFVFAEAERAGWPGPARDLVAHGLDFIHRLITGAETAASGTGDGLKVSEPSLYDQAFLLLALAKGYRVTGDPACESEARTLWRRLLDRFGRPGGGFEELEACESRFQSNPHMHLYEAVQAWRAVSAAPIWAEAMAGFARLAAETFIDPSTGLLREYFDAAGRPMPGELGDQAWPGHQFEWGWLMLGDPGADHAAAARMVRLGADLGIDRTRDVAIFSLRADGTPLDPTARLWSQAERLRGALAMRRHPGEDADFWTGEALRAAATIRRYADDVGGGLYRDVMAPDGTFVVEPSKASSLYHLTGAFMALREAAAD
jgi:mannose-6-phosphate isomerase